MEKLLERTTGPRISKKIEKIYLLKQSVIPQRLRYPSSLQNADPTGYAKALELLGGENTTLTPLWWAVH